MLSLDGGHKNEAARSDQYKKLLDLGLVEQVAAKLDTIYSEGLVNVSEMFDNVLVKKRKFSVCKSQCSLKIVFLRFILKLFLYLQP